MPNFENAKVSTTEKENVNAKAILESMDAILKELMGELVRIDNAVCAPRPCEEKNEPRDECLLATLLRQREIAQALLDLAIHIREGLW